VSVGLYGSLEEAFAKMEVIKIYKAASTADEYKASYQLWKADLVKMLEE
jgi:hypothetical protein